MGGVKREVKLAGSRNSVALKVVAKQVLDEPSMATQCRDEAEIHGRMWIKHFDKTTAPRDIAEIPRGRAHIYS